jgi:hypothetical protein
MTPDQIKNLAFTLGYMARGEGLDPKTKEAILAWIAEKSPTNFWARAGSGFGGGVGWMLGVIVILWMAKHWFHISFG